MDAAECKHVVLGLIFLKDVPDVFAQRQNQLAICVEDPKSDYYMPTEEARKSILKSRDEYTSEGVFWVPEGHCGDDFRKAAKQRESGARCSSSGSA
jgi:type I restriction enzyme M protein